MTFYIRAQNIDYGEERYSIEDTYLTAKELEFFGMVLNLGLAQLEDTGAGATPMYRHFKTILQSYDWTGADALRELNKVTGKIAESSASRVIRNPKSSRDARRAAGSALTQRPEMIGKRKT